MNYQPLILTCDCGYRTPTVARCGRHLSEAKIRSVFRRHSCAKRTDPKHQTAEVACPSCGEPRERLLMGSPVVSTRAERQAAIVYLAERGNLIASGNEAGMYYTHPLGALHLDSVDDADGVTTPELAASP